MSDLPEAADQVERARRGRVHVLGIRIRGDGTPVTCVVVAALKPDGRWRLEIEGLEGSQVLLDPQSLLEFVEQVAAQLRGQGSGNADG